MRPIYWSAKFGRIGWLNLADYRLTFAPASIRQSAVSYIQGNLEAAGMKVNIKIHLCNSQPDDTVKAELPVRRA